MNTAWGEPAIILVKEPYLLSGPTSKEVSSACSFSCSNKDHTIADIYPFSSATLLSHNGPGYHAFLMISTYCSFYVLRFNMHNQVLLGVLYSFIVSGLCFHCVYVEVK